MAHNAIVTQGALILIYIYIINKTYRTDFDRYKEYSLTLTLSNPQLDWVETLLQARMVPREPGKGNFFFIFVAPVLRCSVLAFSIFFLLGKSPLFSRAGNAFPSFSWAFALQTPYFSLPEASHLSRAVFCPFPSSLLLPTKTLPTLCWLGGFLDCVRPPCCLGSQSPQEGNPS